MHNYTLCFNSELSLQHFNFLKRRQKIKLKNLDLLGACLISPHLTSSIKAKPLDKRVLDVCKKKEIILSKIELSSII